MINPEMHTPSSVRRLVVYNIVLCFHLEQSLSLKSTSSITILPKNSDLVSFLSSIFFFLVLCTS